jgi:hypothetical protein
MADTSEETGNRPERPTDFLSLLKIAGVSWSLLFAWHLTASTLLLWR